ncbi:Protein vip1 [Fusarium torreyae]|uniref:Protein vip1 n=1 Tax=Fusarium torreyae TaxID=1237075 RepID=A0A9W8RTU5_9HYPO|nr:Protein vip1 [Fusarium torreyae]
MSANSTINVKNIASSTSDSEIKDFFSFCGKIADLKVHEEGETKSAEVIFEKETAKKTALLLHNTQLGPNHLEVTSAGADVEDDVAHPTNADRDSDEITQEEKPRARILAEYLAHGYVVGDAAIQRGLELDATHNVSNRFFSTLQGLDQKYHATDRAKATDESYGITQRANSLWLGLSSYFEKASNTPTGKKIANFYTEGSRQVQEVHAEARRLADLKKEEHGGSAYKASGLEKVFGKEKTSGTAAPEAGHGTLGTSVPAASADNVPNVSAPEGGEKH